MYGYEISYRHYFMLIFILYVIENSDIEQSKLEEDFYQKLFPIFNNNINSTVLTGIEAFTEFDLGFPYIALYDELLTLTPESRYNFAFTVTPENLSIIYKIKEYSIITRKFAKYLGYAPTDEDIGRVIRTYKGAYRLKYSDVIHIYANKELDTATHSELRIIQGSIPNRMKVFIRLSGQRIINRLFSIKGDVNKNIKTFKLQEYSYMSDNFTAFTLLIFLNCTSESKNNFKDVIPSKLSLYIWFTLSYIKQRNKELLQRMSKSKPRDIIPITATIIMLSKLPANEIKTYINNNFKDTDTKQKTLIRQSITKIKQLQKKEKIQEPYITRLVKEIKHVYKW